MKDFSWNPLFYSVTLMVYLFTVQDSGIESSPSITLKAFDFACKYNLNAFDAMHAGTAFYENAAELITLENPTKPLYQITEVKVKSLLN